MKVSKFVEKRTNKRDALRFLLFVFLLPYVCACLWGHVGEETGELLEKRTQSREAGEETSCWVEAVMEWGIWELPVEEYLIYRLAEVMQGTYEKEAMKAQAVLLRTEIVQACQGQEDRRIQIEDTGLRKFYDMEDREALQSFQEAVEETKGLYLCYQGQPIQASYFQVSNGRTRDAGEVWGTDKCPYLTSIVCGQDKTSSEYSSTATVEREEYLRRLRTVTGDACSEETLWNEAALIYDTAGYVTWVCYTEGGKTVEIEGERFRYLFELQSSSFEIDRNEEQVIFHVSGVGHGFGMSQYGADCKAVNGESYDQILKEFFPGAELAKFE
ncbi:MAG: SpoIID/LytB domain-containing protein [Clostridiales bacterium]|nr:SpoIID/LytB domain-containing protein [Clostridiales bacterium]